MKVFVRDALRDALILYGVLVAVVLVSLFYKSYYAAGIFAFALVFTIVRHYFNREVELEVKNKQVSITYLFGRVKKITQINEVKIGTSGPSTVLSISNPTETFNIIDFERFEHGKEFVKQLEQELKVKVENKPLLLAQNVGPGRLYAIPQWHASEKEVQKQQTNFMNLRWAIALALIIIAIIAFVVLKYLK